MKTIILVVATAMAMPWVAATQVVERGLPSPVKEPLEAIPRSRPPSLFRQIYSCKGMPASARALGEITDWKRITVVGPNARAAALVRERLPDEAFGAGIFEGTRLELQPDTECSAAKLAILAPPSRVEPVRINEARDPSAIARVVDYLSTRAKAGPSSEATDEHLLPGAYSTNYRLVGAKSFFLTPRYTIVLATLSYDRYVLVTEKPSGSVGVQVLGRKYEKAAGPNEPTPVLFAVSDQVTELTKGSREVGAICDRLVSAFKISKRLHVHISANGCENGINGQMVFDLSGAAPKPVFSDWDLSD
jgi:hypothetical protein